MVEKNLPQIEENGIRIGPIRSWSGFVSVLTAFALIVSGVNWTINWFNVNVETVTNSRMRINELQKEIKADIEKMMLIQTQRDLENRRRDAWTVVQQAETRTMVLQFRINDCNLKREETKMSPAEKQICDSYKIALEEAVSKKQEALKEAMSLGKETK